MTLTMSSFDDMGDDDIFYSDEESDNEIFKVGFTLVYFPDTLTDKGCWKKNETPHTFLSYRLNYYLVMILGC